MRSSLFITGTGTGVGKTYATARLLRHLRAQGRDAVGFKPICCGDRDDAELLHEASGGNVPINLINPIWLRTPAAPYVASMIEERPIDLALVHETFAQLKAAHEMVIVEGVGGWLVPITRDYDVSDLAKDFGLPVAVVVANRLGALSDTLLAIESIRARKIECQGLILNYSQSARDEDQVAVATNRSVLEEIAGVPVLFEIAHNQASLEFT